MIVEHLIFPVYATFLAIGICVLAATMTNTQVWPVAAQRKTIVSLKTDYFSVLPLYGVIAAILYYWCQWYSVLGLFVFQITLTAAQNFILAPILRKRIAQREAAQDYLRRATAPLDAQPTQFARL